MQTEKQNKTKSSGSIMEVKEKSVLRIEYVTLSEATERSCNVEPEN